MKPTLKKIALAAALLGSTAIVAPGNAFAGDITSDAVVATTIVAPSNLSTGSSWRMLAAANKKIRIAFAPLGAQAGNVHLHIAYLNAATGASNVIVGQMAATDTLGGTDTVIDFNPTIQDVPGATHVVFFVGTVAAGDVGTGAAAINAGANVLGILPADHNAMTTPTVAAGLAGKNLAASLALTDYQTIVTALLATPAYAIPLQTYTGPTITSIGKTVTSGIMSQAKIQFNTAVAQAITIDTLAPNTIAATESLGADIRFQLGSATGAGDTEDPVASATTTTTGAAGVRNVVTVRKTGPADFTKNYDNADRVVNLGTAVIVDLAGNTMPTFTDTTITAFASPGYASGTASAVLSTGTAADLYNTAANAGAGASTFTVRMSEAIDFDNGGATTGAAVIEGTAATDDADVFFGPVACFDGAGAANGNPTASGSNFTISLTPEAAAAFFAGDDGYVYCVPKADGLITANKLSGNRVTLRVRPAGATGATKIQTTLGGQVIATDLGTVPAFVGIAPAPTVSTNDFDASGVLDGVKVTFGAPVNTTMPATPGTIIFKRGSTATTTADLVANTPVIKTGSADKIVEVQATDAAIQAKVTTSSETAARTNTGSTGTAGTSQIPFEFALNDSQIAYTSVYAATGDRAGALAQVRDIHTNTTYSTDISDGASPVVLSATYLPVEGTTPAAGQLKLVGSEALTTGTLDSAQVILGGSPLKLLNLNDGVTDADGALAAATTTTITGDTVTIGTATTPNVTANVVNKVLTLGTSTSSGITDGTNMLATNGTKTVTSGTTVFAGPKIVQAIGTRSVNAPADGNVDTVIVKFSKGVQLATGGAKVDGMFKLRAWIDTDGNNAQVAGELFTIAIPKENIDITAGPSGYITLTIPSPGIKGTLKELIVEYDANGTNLTATTSTVNRLVSTDATVAEIAEAIAPAFGADDADTRSAQFPKNTTKLYTMELKGMLTTNGSTAAPKGTILRADLVDVYDGLKINGLTVNVPCDCTNGAAVAVNPAGYSSLANVIEFDRKANKPKTKAYLNVGLHTSGAITGVDIVTTNNGSAGLVTTATLTNANFILTNVANAGQVRVGDSVTGTNITGGTTVVAVSGNQVTLSIAAGATVASQDVFFSRSASTGRTYEVEIDTKTGALVGVGSGTKVNGHAAFGTIPSLKILDTVWQVTNDGKFRSAIGTDTAPKNAFILASYKLPDNTLFKGLTSAVESFDTYVPFASNVVASGTIAGGDMGTLNLADIKETSLDKTTNWQLVGFQGALGRTTNDLKRRAIPVSAERLLVSIDGTSGAPATAWNYESGAAADIDEGFLLQNNVMTSALQLGEDAELPTTVDALNPNAPPPPPAANATTPPPRAQFDGGVALALKNPSGQFATDNDSNQVINDAEAINNTVGANLNPFTIFYPSHTASAEYKADGGKWSLLTMEAPVTSLSTWADTNKIGAIIVVGSDNRQKSWFKSATDNTLPSLSQGDRAFFYFETANPTFKFGRS